MSQQSYNHNLQGALDALNQISRYKHLLDIALENTATYSQVNYDRKMVLVETFNMLLDSELDCLETHLRDLYQNIHNKQPFCYRNNLSGDVQSTLG